MSDRYFLDTNLFVYCFDRTAPQKKQQAEGLIQAALSNNSGFISSQIVQEFLNVALRKFEVPLTVSEASAYFETVLTPLCEIFPSIELYRRALAIKARGSIAWFDALVVAAAAEGGAGILYSEDLQHGETIEGVTIQNPFR